MSRLVLEISLDNRYIARRKRTIFVCIGPNSTGCFSIWLKYFQLLNIRAAIVTSWKHFLQPTRTSIFSMEQHSQCAYIVVNTKNFRIDGPLPIRHHPYSFSASRIYCRSSFRCVVEKPRIRFRSTKTSENFLWWCDSVSRKDFETECAKLIFVSTRSTSRNKFVTVSHEHILFLFIYLF